MQAKPMPTRQAVQSRLKQKTPFTEFDEAFCAELDIIKEKLQRLANLRQDE